jgi:hypothetical protein
MRNLTVLSLAATLFLPVTASAGAPAAMTKCTMSFTLAGWSALYKTASGHGRITCADGEAADVVIDVKGGGLTFGKSEILEGKGSFSDVKGLAETLGSYAAAEAHAGAVTSVQAAAYTKGEVSLAVTGKGRGVDLGIDFGSLTISRKPRHARPPSS